MTRVAVSVEGQTEMGFIRRILAEHLLPHGVEATAILIGRARGRAAAGGNVSVERLAEDMRVLLRSFDAVTSLVDYYGFRGKGNATVADLEERIRQRVAERVRVRGRARKVFPYIQRHEFEALLFSDVRCFGGLENAPDGVVEVLRRVRSAFATPEDIDDGRDTAPSKRIRSAMPDYAKVDDGQAVARRIGLATMRAECRGFDRWVRRLESLGSGPPATWEDRS